MTGRLALLYSAVGFAILLIVTVSLFWVLQNSIWRDDADALTREIVELTDLLRDSTANAAMLALEVNPHREKTSVKVLTFLRVWHDDGHILVETQGMSRWVPRAVFQQALAQRRPQQYVASDGRPFLLMASQHVGGSQWGIDAAMDLTSDNELIDRYRSSMLLVLLLGLAVSVAGGWWMTRRGLRPLFEITAVVQRIGVDRLHERVDASRWPMELENLAQAFDQMLDRLEAPFSRLQKLAADLAHELRTPINALIGETEVALSRPRDAEEYRRVLESNLEEHTRLARLIDNLLFLARAEHAQTAIPTVQLDVHAELLAIVSYYEAMAEEQGIEVSCSGAAHGMFDSILLRQAISNLLANALRHTPRGGHVRLVCGTDADGDVLISVADDGVGIGAAELPHVFERFYRTDAARQRHEGGAGLGLAIVQSIVSLHGGRVEMTSDIGSGTMVTMRFPGAA